MGGGACSSHVTCASSMCDFTPALPKLKLESAKVLAAGEETEVSSQTFGFLATGSSDCAGIGFEDWDIGRWNKFYHKQSQRARAVAFFVCRVMTRHGRALFN
jgi:hypothetical protein